MTSTHRHHNCQSACIATAATLGNAAGAGKGQQAWGSEYK
jgi:hypothetical protein